MDLSVIVSTRDRGKQVLPAVQSILRNEGCQWSLLIVDQSRTASTEEALRGEGLLGHPRLTYWRTATVGLSRGRNEGVEHAHGDIVAFTDDDCLVPPGWATGLVRRFEAMPELAVLYAPVRASPQRGEGWVTEFRPIREGLVQPTGDIVRSLGVGANFAVRSSAFATIGPFDEFLGAGATFGGGEDTDFGYRALRAGLMVYTAGEPVVTNCGVPGGRRLYVGGLLAMCMKQARCGDVNMLRPVVTELRRWVGQGTGLLLRGRRPSGYGVAIGALYGVLGSFRYRVDKRRRVYQPWLKGL